MCGLFWPRTQEYLRVLRASWASVRTQDRLGGYLNWVLNREPSGIDQGFKLFVEVTQTRLRDLSSVASYTRAGETQGALCADKTMTSCFSCSSEDRAQRAPQSPRLL